MNKDLEKLTNVDNVVLAMQKLLREREKAKDALIAIDLTIHNLVHSSCKSKDAVAALLNIKHCKKFNEDHKVRIDERIEANYHNGDLEKWYVLKCDKCKHSGCGCSYFNLERNGKSIYHASKESVVLEWLFNGEAS